MLKKVIKAIEKYGMLQNTENITVALSGGADSVCLLYVLRELQKDYAFSLDAIHINHQLRGDEALRDENFVRELCQKLNIPLKVFSVDVRAKAMEMGESIELAARKIRYEVFRREARGAVATAHTASDNLETVLLNMSRGTGIKGVCGIPPMRDIFIRPLIFCTRFEVEEYLKEKQAQFITDSTNLTDEYTRNHLRLNTVPTLKKINPSLEQTVSKMSESLREDEDFLSSTASKIYALTLRDNRLDAELLRLQHTTIIKRVIIFYLNEFCSYTPDAVHLEACLSLLETEGRTQLYGNLFALCHRGFFFTEEDEQNKPKTVFGVEKREIILENDKKINNLLLKNIIDCDKIYGSLELRTRRPSDEIKLSGRNGTKSLKKLFNELKIPKELRDSLPVAADEKGVVWIHTVGVAQRVVIDDNTKKVVEFTVKEINNT